MRKTDSDSKPPMHAKRLGRELAMTFLFSCELKKVLPGFAEFELFIDSVRDEFSLTDTRDNRRAQEYAVKLYEAVTCNKERIDGIISRCCRNWDMERFAFMDILIMQVALAEIFSFPSIPTTVSLNEYVEVAKMYSTPKSGGFINGMLDTIVNQSKKENKLNKA